jgi:hypothetical protein
MGCWLLAGQYGQIAVLVVLLVNIPITFMWATVMDDLVLWLVASQEIADIAQSYTIVILAYQVLQGVSRALTVLIHLSGHEKFEARFAFGESLVMALATCFTAAFAKEATLRDVGCIQLIIGSACFVAKVAFALLRGWLGVFLKGLLRSCAVRVSMIKTVHAWLLLIVSDTHACICVVESRSCCDTAIDDCSTTHRCISRIRRMGDSLVLHLIVRAGRR